MMCAKTCAVVGLCALVAGSVLAGVSAEEAARLGKDLTPLGGEMAGNAYGSKAYYPMPYGAYDILQNIYHFNGKPIPGKFKHGVTEGDKYVTPKGMARSGNAPFHSGKSERAIV